MHITEFRNYLEFSDHLSCRGEDSMIIHIGWVASWDACVSFWSAWIYFIAPATYVADTKGLGEGSSKLDWIQFLALAKQVGGCSFPFSLSATKILNIKLNTINEV